MKQILMTLSIFFLVLSCKNDSKTTNSSSTMNDSIALIERAKDIHNRIITIDTHCDINIKNFTDTLNYTQNLSSQVNLPKMNEGGLDVAWFVVYTGQNSLTEDGFKIAYDNAISKFDAIHKLCEEIAPNDIELATTSEDVRRIVKSGKKVAMIGIENGYPIGKDIKNVEKFYNLGGRYMSLAHNGHSQLSDSNTGEEEDVWLHNGLSELGKEVIKEMNRVGMMIDVSHPSKKAMKQMIELTKAPMIASHSSARALCDHSRNLDDEQLEWLKENGGVVQAVAFSSYLNTEKHDKREAVEIKIKKEILESRNVAYLERSDLKAMTSEARSAYFDVMDDIQPAIDKRLAEMKDLPPAVNVQDFVDHIDYLVKKIGIQHVGISSDFDGGGGIEGWKDASETFNVTLELVKRGYTEDEISMLWSENLLRVLDEVQAVADGMKKS